jgi:hypothetical protein
MNGEKVGGTSMAFNAPWSNEGLIRALRPTEEFERLAEYAM